MALDGFKRNMSDRDFIKNEKENIKKSLEVDLVKLLEPEGFKFKTSIDSRNEVYEIKMIYADDVGLIINFNRIGHDTKAIPNSFVWICFDLSYYSKYNDLIFYCYYHCKNLKNISMDNINETNEFIKNYQNSNKENILSVKVMKNSFFSGKKPHPNYPNFYKFNNITELFEALLNNEFPPNNS